MTEEELKKQASELGKYEARQIMDGKKCHILVGTCLAYEDELCGNIQNAFEELAERLGLKADYNDYSDEVSEIRNKILFTLLKINNADITYGSDEY